MHKLELLAPAGGAEALRAAVRGGADAVYVGLEAFNARRGAENFTLEALREAAAYAHLRGVRVYVALNTAVLPHEAEDALECARQAYRAGADAFIVQDIGIAAELSRTLPDVRLHASTQMNVHNAAGVRAAARLGARRVTLARELALPEIAALADEAAAWDMEVEAFAHGALCVCYSGQCLMSSLIGGRSANRGTCAQACRLPYELRNRALQKPLPSPGEHLLSPQDLCAVDLVPELLEAGVASLKIEGRMKSPEYVQAVTGVYRAVIDRVLAADASRAEGEPWPASVRASAEERHVLEEAFSRASPRPIWRGERGNGIMSYRRPNNRGCSSGAWRRRAQARRASPARPTWPPATCWNSGRARGMSRRRSPSRRAVSPMGCGCPSTPAPPAPCGRGDRVFRVRSAALAVADDALAPRIPVTGTVRVKLGEPLHVAFAPAAPEALEGAEAAIAKRLGALAAACAPQSFEGVAEGECVEAARTKAVTADEVREHVDRLGSVPYRIVSLSVDVDEGVGVGFSQLHRVRARALEDLGERLLSAAGRRVLPRVSPRAPRTPARTRGCSVVAFATKPGLCTRGQEGRRRPRVRLGAHLPARGGRHRGQRSETAETAATPSNAASRFPKWSTTTCLPPARPWSASTRGASWARGRCLPTALAPCSAPPSSACPSTWGRTCPSPTASRSSRPAEFGARRVWLSPELTLEQMGELARDAPVELGLAVIGAQKLMVTEHCLLMSQGPCDERCGQCPRRKSPHYLRDRKGFEFPVVTDALGRSHCTTAWRSTWRTRCRSCWHAASRRSWWTPRS